MAQFRWKPEYMGFVCFGKDYGKHSGNTEDLNREWGVEFAFWGGMLLKGCNWDCRNQSVDCYIGASVKWQYWGCFTIDYVSDAE
jgi:hypothetical protein